MATTAVQSPVEAPRVRHAATSTKREFDRLISEICRKFAQSRSLAMQHLEVLQARSMSAGNSQWYNHFAGSLANAAFAGIGAARVYQTNDPKQFEMYSQIGQVAKNILDTWQISGQTKKEEIQYANTQWQTYANGVQEAIRNAKMCQQRLQQLEDASHR